MIFPCPQDIKKYQNFPLTITLVVLNVFIFILIFSGGTSSDIHSAEILKQESLHTTGRLYYQYMQSLSAEQSEHIPQWLRELKFENKDQMTVLGGFALRDAVFLDKAEALEYSGDVVQISQWRKDLSEFRKDYQSQLLFRFGLSSADKGIWVWLTYQFSHSNWMHLFSNLVFLVLMGAAVEALVGSPILLLVYLVGGVTGGLGFLLSDSHGVIPMVGASASISALMGFYVVAEMRARIRYLYFVSPAPGHYGSIYLPTWLIIPLFLLVDLASLWATPEGLGGGVAYAAHLGGAFGGILMGLVVRGQRFFSAPGGKPNSFFNPS